KKGSGQVEISPAYQRTKLVMEASMSRVQLNKKVVESVNQKHNARIQQYTLMGSNKPNVNNVSITHVNVAAHYCIAKLEQVDASVLEKLEKKCIQAGWSLDKQKGLVYKGAQGSILLMSDIEELSYNSYIEMGNRQLSEELELNVENAQMIVAKSADLQPSKRILPAFEQDLKKSRPKLVSNNKSTFWLFCFEKALVAVKPEVIGLIKLKASVCGEGKSNLGLSL
ncbi:MAG TPA: hypothetical protein VNK03_06655, partial [Gammaproteobacteria bacterium]|nr:hypothetical protein [Gammaproteobacteria bacterium]